MNISKIKWYGWEPALRGMRNPMESWDKADSKITINEYNEENVYLGEKDLKLVKTLVKAGPSHRKFLRQIQISCDISACLKWWDEFDTYTNIVKNSTSQMHKLGSRLLTENDFEGIDSRILEIVNEYIIAYQNNKDNVVAWRNMLDNIPQSYIYIRTVMFNYETFLTIYPNRKNHKMEEWKMFCNILKKKLPYMEMILNVLGEI